MLDDLLICFGYTKPEIHLRNINARKARASEITWGKRQRCVSDEPGGGMTNGMPWKGKSEISASTDIDAHKNLLASAIGPMKLWELARAKKCPWQYVAERIETLAVNVHRSDPEFAEDLDLLALIARRLGR